MKQILKTELSRAIKNRGMLLALTIGIGIALVHAVHVMLPAYYVNLEIDFERYPILYPAIVADTWLAGNEFALESFLYFLVLPLLAVLPFGTSYFSDKENGFLKSLYMRVSRKDYLLAKYAAAFVSGGVASVVPLIVNLLCALTLLPNLRPEIEMPHNIISAANLFYKIYYANPMLYIFIFLCIDFMAGGILFGIILITALILVGLGTFLLSKARTIIQDADFWTNSFSQLISNVCVGIEDFFQIEGGTVEQWVSQRMEEFGGYLTKSGDGLLTGSLRYLSVAGRAGTFVLVSFICVVLFAREIEGWKQGLLNLAAIEPAIDHILSIILRIGKKLGRMIKTYLKTQTIILLCISITAVIGLQIGGTREGWFYGILAGFMDFLPFIGTGIVLIPLGVVSFLKGRIGTGAIIFVTYFICVIIREFLEPRLLGNGLKFSPVAILISVYAGVIYYGIGGVILGPVTLLILVELGREIFMASSI